MFCEQGRNLLFDLRAGNAYASVVQLPRQAA